MHEDGATYVWRIASSPRKSEFLTATVEFGAVRRCYLLDQYSGRQPWLENSEFRRTQRLEFKVWASAILDSNLANQVFSMANGGVVQDGFQELVKFLTRRRWDFSLLFYYLEHSCKAPADDFQRNAIARTEALLQLHTMNESKFLADGTIVPNHSAVDYYLQRANLGTLKEVARHRVIAFMRAYSKPQLLCSLEAIEIALARMFLIKKFEQPTATPKAQFKTLLSFMEQTLEAYLAREIFLATYYFYGREDTKLLGIQANTPSDRALATIRSTAWDMFLLRIPEQLFSAAPGELCLGYIATEEKALARLAKLFTIQEIHGFASGRLFPVVGYVMDGLPSNTPPPRLPFRQAADLQKRVPPGLRDALFAELTRRLPAPSNERERRQHHRAHRRGAGHD